MRLLIPGHRPPDRTQIHPFVTAEHYHQFSVGAFVRSELPGLQRLLVTAATTPVLVYSSEVDFSRRSSSSRTTVAERSSWRPPGVKLAPWRPCAKATQEDANKQLKDKATWRRTTWIPTARSLRCTRAALRLRLEGKLLLYIVDRPCRGVAAQAGRPHGLLVVTLTETSRSVQVLAIKARRSSRHGSKGVVPLIHFGSGDS